MICLSRPVLMILVLGWPFTNALPNWIQKDLRWCTAIKQDPQFIQQLIDLYHEMTKAQMSFVDLRV